MGRRGPAPTPTPILQLRGSTLATQRRQNAEVQGPAGLPEPPDWLDAVARSAWDHVVPLLVSMGVLTRIDGNALARYCRLWSRWKNAEAFIDKHGMVYPLKGEDGKVKCLQQFPQVAIASKLSQQLTRLEQEFGMTPSARARIPLSAANQGGARRAKSRYFDAG
jgi:P27 family predicted phage terminase small subunit